MTVEAQARGVGIGAFESGDNGRPPRGGVELLDLESGTFEKGGEHVGVADLLPALLGAVVHTGIANQGLQQFDRVFTARFAHQGLRSWGLGDSYPSSRRRLPPGGANGEWGTFGFASPEHR